MMIDGLKLTFSGEALRKLLDDRIADHQRCAERWRRDLSPPLPDHMCEHEARRHLWRADVLAFIRDHIERHETYRVGGGDLEFGELFPRRQEQTPDGYKVGQVEVENGLEIIRINRE